MKTLVATRHQLVSVWSVELMTAFLVFVGLHQYFSQVLGLGIFLSLYLLMFVILGVLFIRFSLTQIVFGESS